jgi:Dyp-type peroxidase family
LRLNKGGRRNANRRFAISAPLVTIDLENVQGIVASGYTYPVSRHLLFRFGSPAGARAFVRSVLPVTSAADWDKNHPERLVNVGLSFAGLAATQVLSDAALGRFPPDFRSGPAPERLHDSGAPWWNGVPVVELHCLVSLYALHQGDLDGLTAAVLAAATATATHHQIVRGGGQTIDGALLAPPRRLHFGYMDGFSGPSVAWKDPAQDPDVDFRNFLLGYSNRDIESFPRNVGLAGDAEAVAFARDGSYGAFRLMYQDVAAFNRFLMDNASRLAPALKMSPEEATEWLAARMLGRWRDGRPLVLDPSGTDPHVQPKDAFTYAADAQGWRCPFSAHIRVVNPRDQLIKDSHAPVPRVLRRGMPYGQALTGTIDDGRDRGLIGLFLCANLSDQFAKLLDWINRNDFSNVFTDLRAQDPILGNRDGPLASTDFLIPTPSGTLTATGLTTFVHTQGTAYFLFPSIQALGQLAKAP